jgi:tungstate transport system ATP-binding protein
MTPILEAKDLVVSRNGQVVLNIDYLAVNEGEVLTISGPNGAGKSSLLLTLARLLRPDEGYLSFQGRRLFPEDDLRYRRHIALVLQNPLLTNGSVFNNVALGLRFRRLSKAEITRRVDQWLDRFGITHLRDRSALQLSGGEAQRVSLARAFALKPDILLLDEPFSSLDPPTRAGLLADFQALLADTAMTTVFVTHDMNEALLLGDRLAVLLEGKVSQIGPPDQVFAMPVDPEVAAFVGVETAVPGKVIAVDEGQAIVTVGAHNLEAVADIDIGRSVLFCVRPEDITLWMGTELPPSSARNQLSGPIIQILPKGPLVHVLVDCGFQVTALITRASAREMKLEAGQMVTLTFKASAVHLIPR